MKADLIDALASPKSDPEFGKKYGLAVACFVGSVVVLPAILLVGYLAQTLKHASAGKKGLPEWKALADLTVQGGICLLAALYLIPAALLFAIGYLPLMMGGTGFFSLGAMLNRFISFGALVIALGGMAFTLTGMHSYLHTRQIGDLFNLKAIMGKLKDHSNEMGVLLAMTGVVLAGILILNVFFSGFLSKLIWVASVLIVTFLNLVVFYGTGVIFGGSTAVAPAEAEEPAPLPVPDVVEIAEPVIAEEDTWKPK